MSEYPGSEELRAEWKALNQHLVLADLQVEAIRGLLGEILSGSGSASPATWGPWLLGQLSRILDMREPLEVMNLLNEQAGNGN